MEPDRPRPVLFLGLQRTAVASLLLPLCQATEKTLGGCLLISPCLGHAFLTPLEQLLAGTSAIVSELSRCLGVGSSNLDLYQGQETLKRKAEGLVLPACLWKGPCGPPSCGHNVEVYTGAWQGQPVGFQERCSPIPGLGVFSEETKWKHRVLGGTFPKCGSHLHVSSPTVSSLISALCLPSSLFLDPVM